MTVPLSVAVAADRHIDGVPLPADAVDPSPTTYLSPFSGSWIGQWDGMMNMLLSVEHIDPDGRDARVLYAIAGNPRHNIPPQWHRLDAHIDANRMRIAGDGFFLTFRHHAATGRLTAVFGDGFSFGVLRPIRLEALRADPDGVRWPLGRSDRVLTALRENGSPVSLEVVTVAPPGPGPFPLAVVNHGSTGNGRDPAIAKRTWQHNWLAERLTQQGYMVVFPQRRGRGRSDGLYDEGFRAERDKGYSCDPAIALAGAKRALEDVTAVMAVLRADPRVASAPVLMVGESRGGVLALAYAGAHPQQVSGVINVVGGWLSESCPDAAAVTQSLIGSPAAFPHPTLWLYGADDPYYSLPHSHGNFDAFQAAGGSGAFHEVSVPGQGNGHWVLAIPPLWEETVTRYVDHRATAP